MESDEEDQSGSGPKSDQEHADMIRAGSAIDNDDDDDDSHAHDTLQARTQEASRVFFNIASTLQDQGQKGNAELVERVLTGLEKPLKTGKDLLEDIDTLKRGRTMPATWAGKHKHPAAMLTL